MVESEDRQTLVPFDLAHILAMVPELKKLNTRLDAISFDTPIDSSDMQPGHWTKMANLILEHYDTYDGFVILHGSDTLAYSASALSFMLQGLKKPVVLTGSQLPIGMIRTDARENLITSVEFASRRHNGAPIVQEVVVCFEDLLYRGNRTKKFSTQAFEAFISPNYPVLGEAGVDINFELDRLYRTDELEFKVVDGFDRRVAVLSLFPGISVAFIKTLLQTTDLRGLVIMTFGSGNAPRDEEMLQAIRTAVNDGLVVVNVTQCAKGKVEQGKYETSVGLLKAGVISCGDMTLEATITKLMFLLDKSNDPAWVRSNMLTNLRGELSV